MNCLDEKVLLKINGNLTEATLGAKLSDYIDFPLYCGGTGNCGKCKIVAGGELSELTATEKKYLTSEEIRSGIRLACQIRICGDCEIYYDAAEAEMQICDDGNLTLSASKPFFEKYGVAIDIGTTTLVAKLFSENGELVATRTALNPQVRWGSDVVSRINSSNEGNMVEICSALRDKISELIAELVRDADIIPNEIDGLVITGNTVMLHFLCGFSTETLSCWPFQVKSLFGKTFLAEELGIFSLSAETKVHLPPCISAFVGADLVCAMLAVDFCEEGGTRLLADIGTNGEIALWRNDKLTVCSTAAGPAFEGAGISSGMRGEPGAIDSVETDGETLILHTIADAPPKGICGSGLIDAVACSLELGLIDESGYMENDRVEIAENIFLTQEDVRAVQLAKSAICAGIETLLATGGIELTDVDVLYLAGGFGNYMHLESAEKIGLIPKGMRAVARSVGNAAMSGAQMLLLQSDLQQDCQHISKKANTLQLATNQMFSELYIEGMSFE